jgi:polyphenol oxidase
VTPPSPFFTWHEHLAVDLPGARAVFTTRRGGASTGPYAGLNLGRLTDDRREDVDRNRDALRAGLGVPMAYIRQVHGTKVLRVSAPPEDAGALPEADGQATATARLGLMVLVADCLPVALAGDGAVAMLHAGWRGLAGGILAEGVRAMRELGADGPLTAAIGPGAGPCCYDVGDEVHGAFADYGSEAHHGVNLDLKQIAREQLERAGATVVHDAGICTICAEPSLLYSHRRDGGVTGRQAGVAWLN